jgi:hypothetical protein
MTDIYTVNMTKSPSPPVNRVVCLSAALSQIDNLRPAGENFFLLIFPEGLLSSVY